MSRGQSTQTFNTATKNSATDQTNATNAFGATTNSIGDYNNQLSKFVSGNPYTKGGEYDQTIGAGLANASDAGSNSLNGALQSQALRTGQNSAADAATAATAAQQNTRDLATADATAQQTRMGDEASYNQQALSAAQVPITANASLYGTSLGGADAAQNTAASAAQTPSFWDQVGGGLVKAAGDAGSDIANNIFKG
jgi:hypothetical protein